MNTNYREPPPLGGAREGAKATEGGAGGKLMGAPSGADGSEAQQGDLGDAAKRAGRAGGHKELREGGAHPKLRRA